MHALTARAGAILVALALGASTAAAQTPQPSTESPTFKSPDQGQWMPVPDIFPKGAEIQVLRGDIATGPADIYFKVPSNYTFPWHFHTPIEKLFVDEGTLRWEARQIGERTLESGDYVYVPARSPHRVTCTSATPCFFFLSSSDRFDVHLVDENWNTTRSWRPGTAVGTTGEP